jgi:16S rRNA G966 N2-methylase RsmD
MSVVDEAQLFEIEQPPPVSLADKFGVPPMSVLDRRGGEWQDRKRRWGSLGMQSELGRDAGASKSMVEGDHFMARLLRGETGETGDMGVMLGGGVSIFDPVVCELAYRWHTLPGDRILDPFAGGSVRGIVASTLARWYVGVDLRGEQVAANEAQAHLGSDIAPRWIQGDSARLADHLDPADEFDLVFSCPPYADLEVYSDNPRDLSRMPYEEFRDTHAQIIAAATARLRNDRFAAWVISDVRDKRGAYRGLVVDTIRAFEAAGLSFHNDAVLLDQVGAAAVRAERPFRATRKLTRVHQHLLIFVKGDAKRAATRLEDAA